MSHFILAKDGKTPIPADLTTWAKWLEQDSLSTGFGHQRQAARSVVGNVVVSTIFLALDHSFTQGGTPVLWETMIFGGSHDGAQWRYTSYELAMQGHAHAVELVGGHFGEPEAFLEVVIEEG